MDGGGPPGTSGGNGFDHKEPPRPPDWAIPEATKVHYGEEGQEKAPEVKSKPPMSKSLAQRLTSGRTGQVLQAIASMPRPTPPPDSSASTEEIAGTAQAYASPSQMPAPSRPSIPSGGGGMPAPNSSPDYGAMAANAGMGLLDMIRQSQMAPPDTGPGESFDPYVHGED